MSDPAFADGRPVPVADEKSEAGWFESLCLAHGKDSLEMADFLAEYEQHFARNGSDLQQVMSIVDWHREDLRVLDLYQGRQGLECDPRQLHLSRRCFILAHGPAYSHLAGAETPTDLARQLGLAKILGTSGKATAQKCFSYFQQTLRLPPLPGQRSAEARRNMSGARLDQLVRTK